MYSFHFLLPHFVVFPEKDFVFYIRFFPVSKYSHDDPLYSDRSPKTSVFLCVPRKRVPWSPLYPKESGPLSFHSWRPSLFCRFCLISAKACLPSGASQRAKKKQKNHFWLGDLLGGVGKATSYHFRLEERDLFRWTKMDGGIVLISFSSSVLVPKFAQVCLPSLSQIKFPQKATERNTFPSVLLSFQTACRKIFGENL